MMNELLLERYPDLAFLLKFSQGDKIKREAHFTLPVNLEKLEVIYVYGIGMGLHYKELKSWLHQKKERALVFLEDDMNCIASFLNGPHAREILQDRQAHIHFGINLDELVLSYPAKHIELVSAKKCPPTLALKLYRKASSLNALFSEVLYYHKLLENLLPNIKRAPKAFFGNKLAGQFKNVPAVICGAGPSLASSIAALKTLENKALIFAGGSTLSALKAKGVTPHFGMALDPNPEEYLRLEPAADIKIPFLYANRLLPSVFSLCSGPLGYLRTDTGGIFESWMEEKLGITEEAIGPDLGNEAFSVTTMQVAFATILGCSPIILTGVDLAFTGGKRYSEGVMEDSSVLLKKLSEETRVEERLIKKKGRKGHFVNTLVKWVMESDAISAYAKKHKPTIYINATEDGLGFKGVPFMPLQEAISKYCHKTENFRGRVQSAIAKCPMRVSARQIEKLLEEVGKSLKICETLLEKIILELETTRFLDSGKLLILRIDLEEEIAFDALLQQIGPVLDKMTARLSHQPHLNREISKYKEMLTIVQHLNSVFI